MSDEQKELLKLKAEHDMQLNIARKMLKEGFDITMIKKITGLRMVDIEGL